MKRALLLARVAVLGLPAAADAAKLQGYVVGRPPAATKKTLTVPVILTRASVVRAHMRSSVGVLVLRPWVAVAAPEGWIAPADLRPGDRFKVRVRLSRRARRSVPLRVPVPLLKLT